MKTSFSFRVEGLTETDHQDWFMAREIFIGDVWLSRKSLFQDGLELVKKCKHPEALWLASILENQNSIELVLLVNIPNIETDLRLLCYRGVVALALRDHDWRRFDANAALKAAAELGHSYAQSYMAICLQHDDFHVSMLWAQKSYEQGDPRGAYILAHLHRISDLRKYHPDKITTDGIISGERWPDAGDNRMYLYRAAQMGNIVAMIEYAGLQHDYVNHDGFILLRKAIIDPYSVSTFIIHATFTIKTCIANQLDRRNILFFRIASIIDVLTQNPAKIICSEFFNNDNTQQHFKPLMLLYSRWRNEAIRTRLGWLWAGKQLGVSKDIRIMIAKMIWALRFDVDYSGEIILDDPWI